MSISNIVYKISAIDLISGTLNNINAKTNKLDASMAKFGRTLTTVMTIGAVVEFGKAIVDAGTKVENARIGLTTLLHDSAAAQDVINKAMEDAPKTPFDLVNLIEGEQKLISAGSSAKDARTEFLNLGNAVATTGGNMNEKMNSLVVVMQKIQNRGKATAREMNQFSTQGLNMVGMLQKQGVQVYDNAGKINVSYKQITEGLQKASEKGGQFFGALENMGTSISTKLSNVRDNITNIFVNLFEAGKGIFGPVLDGLNTVLGFIAKITAPGAGLNTVIFLIRTITVALAYQAVAWAVVNRALLQYELGFYALYIAENLALLGIPLLIGAIVAGFMYLSDKVGGVTNAFVVLGEVATAVFNTIGAGVKFIYDLFDVGFGAAVENFKKSVSDTWSDVADTYNKFSKESDKTKKLKGEGEIPEDKSKFGAATSFGSSKGKGKSSTAGLSGPKITTINISVGNLINEFTIQTTNIKEGTTALKQQVTNVLSQALNDSQLIVQ